MVADIVAESDAHNVQHTYGLSNRHVVGSFASYLRVNYGRYRSTHIDTQ